jgi:hypothetical protein
MRARSAWEMGVPSMDIVPMRAVMEALFPTHLAV